MVTTRLPLGPGSMLLISVYDSPGPVQHPAKTMTAGGLGTGGSVGGSGGASVLAGGCVSVGDKGVEVGAAAV